jgi:outer membrane protein
MKRSIFLTIFVIFFWTGLALAQAEPSSQEVLTIDECIRIALQNNYEVRAAEKSYDAAKYNLLGTWQGFLPKADITSYWTRYEHAYLIYPEAGGIPYLSRSSYGLRFNLSQTIFDGWYNIARYNYYKKGGSSAREDLRLTRQWVIFEVKNSCFALLKAQMLLEVQTEAVKRSEEQLNMAKAKYDLGAASLSDYLKAKVQLSNDSLAFITARNSIKLAQADLNNILGLNIDAPIQIDAKLEYEKFDPTTYPITEKIIEDHPQITKTKSEVDQAHSSLTMARSENYPKIYFGVNYSWNDMKFPKSWTEYRKPDDPWYVGMQVSLNIFNGLSTISNIWGAKANLQAAKEKLKKDRREVELEIKTALLAITDAEQKIRVTEVALRSAEEDLNLTKEKYNLGAASMLELLDANYSYKTAKSNQVQSLYDYNLAIAQFEKAVGK